jgi:hypothetical protein
MNWLGQAEEIVPANDVRAVHRRDRKIGLSAERQGERQTTTGEVVDQMPVRAERRMARGEPAFAELNLRQVIRQINLRRSFAPRGIAQRLVAEA